MALQSSGQIDISDIQAELGSSSGSLRTLSAAAGFSAPDAMSEFYGYSSAIEPTEHFSVSTYGGTGGSYGLDSKFGQAAQFGGSSYVTINDATALRLIGDYTISYWVKQSTTSGIHRHINKDDAQDFSAGYAIYANGGQISFVHNNGSNNTWDTGYYISANTWYHICVTYSDSGNIRRFYVNGSQHSTFYTGANLTGEADKLFFGTFGDQSPSGQYLTGSLDQVRIYSATLSAAEVSNLYNETNPRTSNLVAHYKLDGNVNDETGNYNGVATNIGYVGMDFTPGLVWVKDRDAANWHMFQDQVRGVGKCLFPNALRDYQQLGESGNSGDLITSFDSKGFTVNSTYLGGLNYTTNQSSHNYVAWCWRANGPGSTNTSGTQTSIVSANQAAGFSIATFSTGTSPVQGETYGHGLGAVPEVILTKSRGAADGWILTSSHLPYGWNDWVSFDNGQNLAGNNDSTMMHAGAPTSTLTSLGRWNTASNPNVAYSWRSISGYSKFGMYSGNGSSVGNTITTGFQPRCLIILRTNVASSWMIYDSVRDTASIKSKALFPDRGLAEGTIANAYEFGSTYFRARTSDPIVNASGSSYFYMAFA